MNFQQNGEKLMTVGPKIASPGQAMRTPRDVDTHLEGTLFGIVFLHLSSIGSLKKGMNLCGTPHSLMVFGKWLCQLQDMTVLAWFSYQMSTAKEQFRWNPAYPLVN